MLLKNLLIDGHRGETLARILMNTGLEGIALSGKILDVGGSGERSPYFNYLRISDTSKVIAVDVDPQMKPTVVADVEKGLPLSRESFDAVVSMNLLEHIQRFDHVLKEMYRVLRPGGRLVGSTPFLFPIHPVPRVFKDCFRYTDTALECLMTEVGYVDVRITPHGFGPAGTALFFLEYPYLRVLRWIPLLRFALFTVATIFDCLFYFPMMRLRKRTTQTPFVLVYTFEASRPRLES